MSRHASELTDAQWAHIAPLLPEPTASPKGGPKPIANRLCGYYGVGFAGKTCLSDTPLRVRAGVSSAVGKPKTSG